MKIKIEINPNGYNTSSDEITKEIASYIPVLEQIVAFVDYDSNEQKESAKLVDALVSIITEENVAEKLQPITTILNRLGEVSDVLNIIDIAKTIYNWNSATKQATEVSVFVQIEQGKSYWYHASVDDELSFKKLYSAYTGTVIQKNESRFIIDVQR